nr:NPP1 family protein [Saccharopolyspora sp. HNM0983]
MEHVVVWVEQGTGTVGYVAASAHGEYETRHRDEIAREGGHPKIVYHKDGGGHARFPVRRRRRTTGEPPRCVAVPGAGGMGRVPPRFPGRAHRRRFRRRDAGAGRRRVRIGPGGGETRWHPVRSARLAPANRRAVRTCRTLRA